MKIKTSITLSVGLLAEVDRAAGSASRSAFIEQVLKDFLLRRALDDEQARDRQLLDEAAIRLNREAGEVLEYQAVGFSVDD